MIITLVRHGEVEEAYQRCYNGHNNIGLSLKGKEEAALLANCFHDRSFDAVYCSDLKRCRQTIEPFTQNSIVYTPLLREKSWGRHEGMGFEAIVERDGLEYKSFEQWITALDGEPYDAYIERIKHFFTEHLPQQSQENVLVVTHAGVIRVLMHLLQNITLEDAFSVNFPYSAYTTLNTKTWKFGAIQCV
jgi:alpha-ribazole phosphatase